MVNRFAREMTQLEEQVKDLRDDILVMENNGATYIRIRDNSSKSVNILVKSIIPKIPDYQTKQTLNQMMQVIQSKNANSFISHAEFLNPLKQNAGEIMDMVNFIKSLNIK